MATIGVKPPSPQTIWATLDPPWRQQVETSSIQPGELVLINEADPESFLASLWSGLLAGAAIVLANPTWGQREWHQVATQLSPDRILGQTPAISFPPSTIKPSAGQILIATGGTSGHIKFVVHTWATLVAAAQGFIDHFQSPAVNSYCVLPLYHVSGLMQALRGWISGGTLVTQSFKQLETGQRLIEANQSWFISLVPTQLQRLMGNAATIAWLAQFRAILLGGAPAWHDLLAQCGHLPIALTYGMSETAAQVATLWPADFQMGIRSSGPSLPHVTLAIHTLEMPLPLPVGSVGRIALQSPSLGLGYWLAEAFPQSWFYPDDLGYLDGHGHLHVVGRSSQKIITGGENVFPAEVEAALLATGHVCDVYVIGVPDKVWGQAVAALYVPVPEVTCQQIKASLRCLLSPYKQPKRWLAVDQIPRNHQGKVNRSQVMARLATELVQDSTDDADD